MTTQPLKLSGKMKVVNMHEEPTQHKHTALPWKQGIIKTDVVIRYETDNGSYEADIARCNTTLPNPKETDQANAAFIVKACNNHYKLIEALERIKNTFAWDELDADELAQFVCKILKEAKGEV